MPTCEGGYKAFKIGELFDIHPTKAYKLTNIGLFTQIGTNPVVANSSMNNGIGGYSNLPTTEVGNMITFSDTTTSDAIFYQPRAFIGYPHIQGLYAIKYRDNWNEKTLLYFVALFRKCAQGRFDYATKFTRKLALEMEVLLPTTSTGEIDFAFMEQWVRGLEKERMCKLKAYLQAAGFDDCTMSAEENEVLRAIAEGRVRSKKVKIGELFGKLRTNALGMKVADISKVKTQEQDLPVLTAGIVNQGLVGFVSRKHATILQNVISVSANGANTGAMFYQPHDFTILQDSYAIGLQDSKIKIGEKEYLYLVACLQKSIRGYYDWSNKAGWEKIKSLSITLPVTESGDIDYAFMETTIRAMEKQCIARLKDRFMQEEKVYRQVIH